MYFKNTRCLTKVSKNQSKVTTGLHVVTLNLSNIELVEKKLTYMITDREVMIVGFRSEAPIILVESDKSGEIIVPESGLDILVLTKELYTDLCKTHTKEDVYKTIMHDGLYQISLESQGVQDFCVLITKVQNTIS